MSTSASASTPTRARAGAVAPGQAEHTPAAATSHTFRSLEYGFGLWLLHVALHATVCE